MNSNTWDILSSVANSLMALFALIAIWQNRKQLLELKKQYNEDSRVRLTFEIISDKGLFLLKISNVGKATAYNTRIIVESSMLDNHYSNTVKSQYEEIKRFNATLVAGRNLYYIISPIKTANESTYRIGMESFNLDVINKWLDMYWKTPIYITGSYCGIYDIKEVLSLQDFMAGGSIIVEDSSTIALKEISRGLSCKNDSYRPIQENIEKIMNIINQISTEKKNNIYGKA